MGGKHYKSHNTSNLGMGYDFELMHAAGAQPGRKIANKINYFESQGNRNLTAFHLGIRGIIPGSVVAAKYKLLRQNSTNKANMV